MFHNFFFKPLYNAFVFLLGHFPWLDVGVLVVIFTVLIKLILLPLSKKATRSQILMTEVQPEIEKIKKEEKDPQLQAKKMLALYQQKKLNPLSGIFVMILQLPVIFALYFIFRGSFPTIDPSLLYTGVLVPASVKTMFLGLIDVAKPSVILAIFAGASQFLQMHVVLPKSKPKNTDPNKKASFAEDFSHSMNWQMRYVMPLIILLVALKLSAALSIYWITSNLFAVFQDLHIKKSLRKEGVLRTL